MITVQNEWLAQQRSQTSDDLSTQTGAYFFKMASVGYLLLSTVVILVTTFFASLEELMILRLSRRQIGLKSLNTLCCS